MTTGIRDYQGGLVNECVIKVGIMTRTFMMSSGRNVPSPAIPIPDFEVPKAAPTAI